LAHNRDSASARQLASDLGAEEAFAYIVWYIMVDSIYIVCTYIDMYLCIQIDIELDPFLVFP